jgi:hypothetical protein
MFATVPFNVFCLQIPRVKYAKPYVYVLFYTGVKLGLAR